MHAFLDKFTRSVFGPALASSLLCWLALPPVGWGGLAWCAPIGWLWIVARPTLLGAHPYRALWGAGLVFWLLALHWLRLPHPANYLAWFALASYLGCYLPLFVALARVGVHRLALPLWWVAPVVWTGLDWLRAHLMTGFLMGSLAHTQVASPRLIQIANVLGEYGVTFVIVLVASSLCSLLSRDRTHRRWLPLLPGGLALVATLLYGALQPSGPAENSPVSLRIALVQGNTLADWKNDSEKQQQITREHLRLSLAAAQASLERDQRALDLAIWPETAFRQPLVTTAAGYLPPATHVHKSFLTAGEKDLQEFVRQTGAALLTGIDRIHYLPDALSQPDYRAYNSSVLINQQGRITGTYDKMHLVLMGEYVPFTDTIPWLKKLTPITGLAIPGEQPQALATAGFTFCPNICYETVVPHLIRQQVTTLTAADQAPDALVNLTNDAWFWGSSELEMHLACGIFRAVEMRLPLLIAANGGLSAHIDPSGQVLAVTPRQHATWLLVDLPKRDSAPLTCYARWGDWFAGLCMVCCVVFAAIGWRSPAFGSLD
jgi:apolipoprotein N-acyltransferase